eukprot:jgi/Undpi1/2241/HiC_scaffold_12.g05627.m1
MAMGLVESERMEPRTMESMDEMGEHMLAGLRAELQSAEVQLSHWVAEREQRLGDLQAGFERSMEARANEVLDLRKAKQEASARQVHCLAVAKQQKEQLQEEVQRLEELKVKEEQDLPSRLKVLEAEHARVSKELEAKRGEMANRRYLKEEDLSALGRGVVLYSRLGLHFENGLNEEGPGKCLRLVFQQISRNDPQRQFIIGIKVSDSGVYFAPECNPPLPAEQLEEMLAEVNRTNRFGGFVSRRTECLRCAGMVTPVSLEWAARRKLSISKLRRRGELAPATLELQETFALRRILLKHGQRTEVKTQADDSTFGFDVTRRNLEQQLQRRENELSFLRKFLAERTTMWREPFWALLSKRDQLKVAQCVKLRIVPSDGEPHDCVAADSASGCMIFVPVKGSAQVQCFDAAGTKLEFTTLETFGFLPVPDMLKEGAVSEVEKVKTNPRSTVYRGEREYGERRQLTTDAGKIRVKIAPDGQYLSINGAEVVPILKKVAEKHGRRHLMKTMGLELPGMGAAGGGGGGVGGVGGEGGGRKREVLMRDARYGVGSILVEEGAGPTSVFLIVEGECRIIKGKPRTQSAAAPKVVSRGARYNLRSGQSSKVGVVLTSGFHTQVDVCHLGSLGPKALVGDIPALLGGVQPASVVAKTPLTVLQCRADKFAAHLDHNVRAKIGEV